MDLVAIDWRPWFAGVALATVLLGSLLLSRLWLQERRRSLVLRLRLPFFLAAAYLLLSQILRAVLCARFWPGDEAQWPDAAKVFLAGIHIDAAAALAMATVPAIWCLLRRSEWRGSARLWLIALASSQWLAAVFLLLSEYYFFDEFTARFNTVAIDYLIYPQEVFTNLRESYNLPVIFLSVVAGASAVVWTAFGVANPQLVPGELRRVRLGYCGVWCAGVAASVWSVRPAETNFSAQRVVNELANNGLASAAWAAWTRNLDYAAFYPTMSRDEAFVRTRALLATPESKFVAATPSPAPAPNREGRLDPAANDAWVSAAALSLQRRIAGDPQKPRLNVCILLEESLGSEFWGALGRHKKSGKPDTLTPQLDRIAAEEGLLFDNIFADGNRTIRGFEGVFSSFPPMPGDSILARDRTENVETIARVLARDGYQSLFVYGGRGAFDHIASYTLPNGWDRLIQQDDFPHPTHVTAWGVCDEDVYHRLIHEMRLMHSGGRPFLASCMTVSNHLPFSYPRGRIAEDPDAKSRKHAVKYADWALGDFFSRAKSEAFWGDTIFVVIADHGARVYGSQTIPMKSYEIPLLIVGGAVVPQPRRVSTLGCQLDVTPTILGLIGRPYDTLFFGHDLLRESAGSLSRCLMHHNRSVAIYRAGRQVVFGLNKQVEYWLGDPHLGKMQPMAAPDPPAQELALDATALFQVADELYMHRKYRVRLATRP